jgi:MurNAc alpha-1-phosphate uridylyltransferase
MKAMILAAGRGERMRPLTDRTPKPLLEVGGKPLVQHHIEALRDAGFRDLVINHAHLGEQIVGRLGDGAQFDVNIEYSAEPAGALETGGGIKQALALLGNQPFVVINADIWTDYPFERLCREPEGLAHLVLVDNPPHHSQGDFRLIDGRVSQDGEPKLTFSGIGLYRPQLFSSAPDGAFPLGPLLREAMREKQVSGEYYQGQWMDIGTPQRLSDLNRTLRAG